ncbi:hypothetical protein LCGC14_0303290 [marine sediment metagenome]|uniref:Glycosyltransferase subfamily 4-like N-terminal domain-containing protein n=1 Tax=marine sediment metagenome TaxID=412755 RepID=A0A0F9WVU0_9ZZZZ
MNILILGQPESHHPGKWAKALAKNHDVIFGFFDGDRKITSLDQLKTPPTMHTEIIGKNINIKYIRNLLYRWEMNSFMRHKGWRSRALRKFVKQHDIDVIFAHGLGYYSYIAAGNKLVPVVSASYGSEVFQYFSEIVQYVIDKVDAIQCTSPLMHHTILDRNSDANVHEFYWGVDCSLFRPRSYLREGNTIPLIYFSRGMSDIYRGDFIVETLEKFQSPQNIVLSTHLVTKKQLERIKETPHNIYYHDYNMPLEEYAIFIAGTDIMVSIPISDQIGNSVMEFMAAGIPMILSDLSVYDPVFGIENVEVADLSSPSALAKQIENFGINDGEEIRQFAEDNFNWETAVTNFELMCLDVNPDLL